MKRKEDFLQYRAAQVCRDRRIVHTHVPNASKRSAREGARLKAMGMVAGVHDLLLFFSDALVVLVELKTDTGDLSPKQKDWHTEMTRLGHYHHVIEAADADELERQLNSLIDHYLLTHTN